MKPVLIALFITLFSTTVFAEQTMRPDGRGGWIITNDTSPCAGLKGWAAGSCQSEQREMQKQQIRLQQQQQMQQQQYQEQQLQLQREQLQQQQQLQELQIENQRLQNEIMRMKLEQEQQTKKSKQSK